MTIYVWRDGQWRDKKTNKLMKVPKHGALTAPFVVSDIPDHFGPSGRLITSRSGQRDEWKRTQTCAWEPLQDRPRGIKNPEVKEWVAEQHRKIDRNEYLPSLPIARQDARKIDHAQREVLAKHYG